MPIRYGLHLRPPFRSKDVSPKPPKILSGGVLSLSNTSLVVEGIKVHWLMTLTPVNRRIEVGFRQIAFEFGWNNQRKDVYLG